MIYGVDGLVTMARRHQGIGRSGPFFFFFWFIFLALLRYHTTQHHAISSLLSNDTKLKPNPSLLCKTARYMVNLHVDHDLEDQVPLVVLDLARHAEGLGDAVEALVAVRDELRDGRQLGVAAGQQLDDARVRVRVAEDADQVDLLEGGGRDGQGLDGVAHADDEDLAAWLCGL